MQTPNLIDSMPVGAGNKRLVNDTSVYYKGLIGMILCILPGALNHFYPGNRRACYLYGDELICANSK
jgi:hypothetical protein